MLTVENKFNINSKVFKDILKSEADCLAWLNNMMCVGMKRDIAYDTLKKIRARKEAYEKACLQKQSRY